MQYDADLIQTPGLNSADRAMGCTKGCAALSEADGLDVKMCSVELRLRNTLPGKDGSKRNIEGDGLRLPFSVRYDRANDSVSRVVCTFSVLTRTRPATATMVTARTATWPGGTIKADLMDIESHVLIFQWPHFKTRGRTYRFGTYCVTLNTSKNTAHPPGLPVAEFSIAMDLIIFAAGFVR